MAFKNPRIPRSELLRRFRAFLDHFPSSAYSDNAERYANILEMMVAQDEAYAPPTDFEALSDEEKIRELIFQLRDQRGFQSGEPGWVSVLGTSWPGVENARAADRLLRFGVVAAPQLIEASDDPELSRAVGCHRSFYFSHRPITVGECALQILGRIAGQGLRDRAAAEKWWSTYEE